VRIIEWVVALAALATTCASGVVDFRLRMGLAEEKAKLLPWLYGLSWLSIALCVTWLVLLFHRAFLGVSW
jgi:hypothetical protein